MNAGDTFVITISDTSTVKINSSYDNYSNLVTYRGEDGNNATDGSGGGDGGYGGAAIGGNLQNIDGKSGSYGETNYYYTLDANNTLPNIYIEIGNNDGGVAVIDGANKGGNGARFKIKTQQLNNAVRFYINISDLSTYMIDAESGKPAFVKISLGS